MTPGRAAEQTGLPWERCASISPCRFPAAPWVNLVHGHLVQMNMPHLSRKPPPTKAAFLQIHLKCWCPMQTTGHLHRSKTTDSVCKKNPPLDYQDGPTGHTDA